MSTEGSHWTFVWGPGCAPLAYGRVQRVSTPLMRVRGHFYLRAWFVNNSHDLLHDYLYVSHSQGSVEEEA